MFQFREWLIDGIVQGYRTGEHTWSETVLCTADYVAQGVLSNADAEAVERRCHAASDVSPAAGSDPPFFSALLPEAPEDGRFSGPDHITFSE